MPTETKEGEIIKSKDDDNTPINIGKPEKKKRGRPLGSKKKTGFKKPESDNFID